MVVWFQRIVLLIVLFTGSILAGNASSEGGPTRQSDDRSLTLKEAISLALSHYPTVAAAQAQEEAASVEIDLVDVSYLPNLELFSQVNRATRNNVFGLLLPHTSNPSISGPVMDDATFNSSFGTSAGLFFSWELTDFGLRQARIAEAERRKLLAQAGTALTRFEITAATLDSFLSVLEHGQAVSAATANQERLKMIEKSVGALVSSGLRPGADEMRVKAELARAQAELVRSEEMQETAEVELQQWVGLLGQNLRLEKGRLLDSPPKQDEESGPFSTVHPLTSVHTAKLDVIRAKKEAIAKENRPKVELLSSIYARGTGAELDGTFKGGAHGLVPSVGNWAVGVGIRFDLFQEEEIRLRRRIEEIQGNAEEKRLEETRLLLQSQATQARVQVASAWKVADSTEDQLIAAKALVGQSEARYKSGLGPIVEVAEANRLLRQAETDAALARLRIWRAMFREAAAQGDFSAVLSLCQ